MVCRIENTTFLSDLEKVLKKHGVWLSGVIRLKDMTPDWDKKTASSKLIDIADYGHAMDKTGPFIKFSVSQVEKPSMYKAVAVRTVLMDKDKLLAEGVKSPITKQSFSNRRDWNNHLKANGCVEIGNDFNNAHQKPIPLKGDFDCTKELSEATHQVMEKYAR